MNARYGIFVVDVRGSKGYCLASLSFRDNEPGSPLLDCDGLCPRVVTNPIEMKLIN